MQTVYIVDGVRTPWLKVRSTPGPFSASDLAVYAARTLLLRQTFAAHDLDEIVTGCVMPQPNEANISRIIALRLGCGPYVPAYTVQRNCASGLQAIDNARLDIMSGRCDLVLAGGTEAMSHAPVLFSTQFIHCLAAWRLANNWQSRLKALCQFSPKQLRPIWGLLQGLIDPIVGLSMGQTAEVLAHRFGITRLQADEFALLSHQRLARAYDHSIFSNEIIPLIDYDQHCYQYDDGLRRDTNLSKLQKLSPVFDKPFGSVTAGNSAQITDGAAFLLLANKKAIQQYQLPVLARLVQVAWAGVKPEEMGLGPVHAVAYLMKQQKLNFSDIDFWEINEAFSAQLLACLSAWQDKNYCQTHFDHDAFGAIDLQRLNINGGAIAMGHPVGATGARIVLHLIHNLKRQCAQRGIATLCIGGGQGGAVLVEQCSEVV